MYIIVELEELQELVKQVEYSIDPDAPCDEDGVSPVSIQRASEILDVVLGQQHEISEDIENLVCDDQIRECAMRVVQLILRRLSVDTFQWIKVIDHLGGLVIRLKPGALTCRP
jgi:hypothetical protein